MAMPFREALWAVPVFIRRIFAVRSFPKFGRADKMPENAGRLCANGRSDPPGAPRHADPADAGRWKIFLFRSFCGWFRPGGEPVAVRVRIVRKRGRDRLPQNRRTNRENTGHRRTFPPFRGRLRREKRKRGCPLSTDILFLSEFDGRITSYRPYRPCPAA